MFEPCSQEPYKGAMWPNKLLEELLELSPHTQTMEMFLQAAVQSHLSTAKDLLFSMIFTLNFL